MTKSRLIRGFIMYVKVYSQIFDSTIADDFRLRHFFIDLLILAERSGVVDMTETAIARRTGIPLLEVQCFLKRLMEPDPASRTPDMDGRRIVLVDDHKPWGWQIVNFAKYRGLQNEDQRKEQMRVASANYRDRLKKRLASSDDESNNHQISSKEEAEAISSIVEAKIQTQSNPTPIRQETTNPTLCSSVDERAPDIPSIPLLKAKPTAKLAEVEAIYQSYPRKVGKAVALKAIAKAMQNGNSYAVLLDAVQEFATSPAGKAGQFCPHPATWFNRESFKDDRREWKRDRYSDSVSAATKHSEGFADDLADVPTQHCPIAQCASPILAGLRADQVPF